METKKMNAPIRISKTADTSGIKPEDCVSGASFTICADNDGVVCEQTEREGKQGTFKQYALHLQDAQGNKRMLSFLFEKHLAVLSRAFGSENPDDWAGKQINVYGFKKANSEYWDVRLEGVPVTI